MKPITLSTVFLAALLVLAACSTSEEVPGLSTLAKPDIEDLAYDLSYPIGCADLSYDFEITENLSVNVRIIRFFDQKTQEMTRAQVIYKSSATFAHSELGDVASTQERGAVIYDFEEGKVAIVGINYNITMLGKGVVVQSVGRLVFDLETFELIFEAGPHVLGFEAVALFCAVFAQEPLGP